MKIQNRAGALTLAAWAVAAMPLRADAHHAMGNATPGNAFEGLVSGLAHPVIGVDHLLFILAIGAACYYFGQRAGTIVTVLAATIAGTGLHLYKATLAYPDAWVALSLVVLGILFFRGSRFLKTKAALAMFAIAGIAHGYAYGEAIVGAEPTPLYAYLAGYTVVQLCIAFAGYAAARYADAKRPSVQTLKALGGGLCGAGVAFLFLSLSAQ